MNKVVYSIEFFIWQPENYATTDEKPTYNEKSDHRDTAKPAEKMYAAPKQAQMLDVLGISY